MIRFLFCIVLALWLLPSQAQVPVSFERSIAAFEAGEYESARTAFDRMAQAGFTEAQFNLGAMLLNGQGGEADLVEGAAWIQVAAEHGYEPAVDTLEMLRAQLNSDQLAGIDSKAAELMAVHGRQALLERHRPRAVDPSAESQPEQFESSTVRRRGRDVSRVVTSLGGSKLQVDMAQPSYPRSAAERGVMGIVELAAWVEPSGEVSHPHVVSAYPEGVFDREALLAYQRLEAKWLEEPPAQAQYLRRTIVFSLVEVGGGPIIRELEQGIEAHEDNLAAQYRLVWLSENLSLDNIEPIDSDAAIEVIHRAATAGVVDAQINLARKFRGGSAVEEDATSANFWLKQATFEGDAKAAFELSRCDMLDEGFRQDLRRAAIDQGHLSALLLEIRELTENPEQASPEEMATLLERLPREFRRDSRDPVPGSRRLMN